MGTPINLLVCSQKCHGVPFSHFDCVYYCYNVLRVKAIAYYSHIANLLASFVFVLSFDAALNHNSRKVLKSSVLKS